MQVIDNAVRAQAFLPGISHRTLACSDDGLNSLSVWQQELAPGSCSPPHVHDCEEVVVVLEGSGEVHATGAVHRFTAGNTLVVPAGMHHQIFSTGNGPLRIVAVLSATPVQTWLPDGTLLDLPWRT